MIVFGGSRRGLSAYAGLRSKAGMRLGIGANRRTPTICGLFRSGSRDSVTLPSLSLSRLGGFPPSEIRQCHGWLRHLSHLPKGLDGGARHPRHAGVLRPPAAPPVRGTGRDGGRLAGGKVERGGTAGEGARPRRDDEAGPQPLPRRGVDGRGARSRPGASLPGRRTGGGANDAPSRGGNEERHRRQRCGDQRLSRQVDQRAGAG